MTLLLASVVHWKFIHRTENGNLFKNLSMYIQCGFMIMVLLDRLLEFRNFFKISSTKDLNLKCSSYF